MAAATELCRLCHEILPKRSRRTIFGDTFGVSQQLSEVLGYVPHVQDGISRYVCGFCFTKLNKLSKIDYDILHRVESLRAEKYDMIKTLRSKYLSKFQSCQSKVPSPDVSTSMTNTPTRLSKRVGLHSPTPRKVKKPMQATPRRNVQLTSKPDNIQNVPSHTEPPAKKRVAIQLFSPDKVKVLYRTRTDQLLRTHVVPKGYFQNIVKNISKNCNKDRISHTIYKSSLKESINKCIVKEVIKESNALCAKNNNSVLRNIKVKIWQSLNSKVYI